MVTDPVEAPAYAPVLVTPVLGSYDCPATPVPSGPFVWSGLIGSEPLPASSPGRVLGMFGTGLLFAGELLWLGELLAFGE